MKTEWRIYYDDGHRLDGPVGIPRDRREGVLVVVERNEEMEWEIHHSANHYILLKSGRWIYVDDQGRDYYIRHKLQEMVYCLAGVMVPYEEYRAILERAQRELDPPKTAWRRGEKL